MRVARVRLKNYGPFRGLHDVSLDPGVYAVIARWEQDPQRSNYGGKTTFVHAVPFALFGTKLPSWQREDDWITEGEEDGFVEVTIEPGGFVFRRERKRGGPTRNTVQAGEFKAARGEADAFVTSKFQVDAADFYETFYFEQKDAAHLLLATPGERADVIAGLLRLDNIDRCVDDVDLQISKAQTLLLEQKQRVEKTDELIKALRPPPGESEEDLLALVDLLRADAAALEDQLEAHSVWEKHAAAAEELAGIVVEGKKLAAEAGDDVLAKLTKDVAVASKEKDDAQAAAHEANRVYRERGSVAAGNFSGRCPVADIDCPATTLINGRRLESQKAAEEAKRIADDAQAALQIRQSAAYAARERHTEILRKSSRLADLRARKTALLPSAALIRKKGVPLSGAELRAKAKDAQVALGDAQAGLRLHLENSVRGQKLRADAEDARQKLRAAEQRLSHLNLARAVFTRARNGIAEGALSTVVDHANDLLGKAGIDLLLEASWAREASGGLAASCGACGHAYPASQKVKECSRCGVPRGVKTIERLDLKVSDRSGAADDLAGIAFQLAAARWVAQDRGTAWGTFIVDEPFGALDAANRRAFAAQLGMLFRDTAEQAFVIAHSPDVLHALPRRVEISVGLNGSSVRVV